MKFTWIILAVLLGAYYFWSRRGGSGIKNISASDLQERIKSDPNSLEIVDVREPSEFKGGHILKAKNIPLGRIGEKLSDLPKDKDVVFVCRSGGRSMMASRKAQKAGLKGVYNLSGGMSAWRGPTKE